MKVTASNKKAKFDYSISETVEAGLMLTGPEVKSCRLGHVSLAGSYVSLLSGKPVVKQMKISPYKPAGKMEGYNESRDRVLLLKSSDIERLKTATEQKGMTLVPLEMQAGNFVKLVIGLAVGRKKFDKREVIKKRDLDRELRGGKTRG